MHTRFDNPHGPTLEILETLRDGEIRASIAELRQRDRTTLALRAALRAGVPVSDLSDASGLTVAEIERRVAGELHLGEDIASLCGTA
jgi:hypothetical protein